MKKKNGYTKIYEKHFPFSTSSQKLMINSWRDVKNFDYVDRNPTTTPYWYFKYEHLLSVLSYTPHCLAFFPLSRNPPRIRGHPTLFRQVVEVLDQYGFVYRPVFRGPLPGKQPIDSRTLKRKANMKSLTLCKIWNAKAKIWTEKENLFLNCVKACSQKMEESFKLFFSYLSSFDQKGQRKHWSNFLSSKTLLINPVYTYLQKYKS